MKYLLISITLLTALFACSNSDIKLKELNQQQPILAFGDSLTFGKGATASQSYPAQLSDLLNIEVINKGVNGELSKDGLQRLALLLDKYDPQLLLLCHGGNDLIKKQDLNKLSDNLKDMIKLAKERDIQVVLIAVPKPSLILSPLKLYKEVADEMQVAIENEVISDVLQQQNLHSDMAHPNDLGYEKIAQAIYQLLQENGALG
ncbi:MAG: GDSL-type esterase/lipase family protein [Psychromonas sp.]